MSAYRSTQLLAWLLSFLILVTPTLQVMAAGGSPGTGVGDDSYAKYVDWGAGFNDSAAAGQAFGDNQLPDPSSLFGAGEGGQGYTIFPDSEDPMQVTPGDLFGSEGHGSKQELKDLWGDDRGIDDKIGATQKRLDKANTWTGKAYRTLLTAKDRLHPDMTDDSVFDTSKDIMNKLFQGDGEFSACDVTHELTEGSDQSRIHDYKLCTSVEDKVTGHSTITHPYTTSVIEHESGPVNVQTCGEDCLLVWLGRVGDNYWSGHCAIFEHNLTVRVINPDAIINGIIDRAKWDDYMQIWLGGKKVWSGPHGNSFPPETGGACELSTSWDQNPNTDITQSLKGAKPGSIVSFKIRVSVTGKGEGYARLRVGYDHRQALSNDVWEISDRAQQQIEAIESGFASGTYTCTKMPKVNSEGVAIIDGNRFKEDQFKPSPIPGISPFCQEVEVRANLDFNQGDMQCFIDANGVKRCPTNEGGNPNSCTQYENDSSCVFVDSECLDGAKDRNGVCYAYTGRYDCGEIVNIPTAELETQYSCPGGIRCKGGDCIDFDLETNNDFGRTAALLQAADYMAMDMSCPGGTDDDQSMQTCKVFSGEATECKVAVGGIQDCCDVPVEVSLAEYITMMQAMRKLSGFVIGEGAALHGAWTQITKPITDAWSSVTNYFSSSLDANSASTPLRKIGLDQLKQAAMKKTAEFMVNNFGMDAASLFFEGSSEGGLESALSKGLDIQLGGAIGSMLSMAMTAYAIYSFAKLAIQMIWKCTEDEYQLRMKRELKSAHYIGSYCNTKVLGICIEQRRAFCTFASPLSRILQEQIRAQMHIGWGSAKHPSCQGITIAQMQQVDWNQVDLSEWLAILSSTGHMPSINDAAKDYALDQLTGSIPTLDVDIPGAGPREDVATRNQQRMGGGEDADAIDCSLEDNADERKCKMLSRNEDLRQHFWGSEGDLAIGDENFVCKPGHALFVYTGAPVTFDVPANCNDMRIEVEGGDSGFAGNIPVNAGQHVSTIEALKPTDSLVVYAGSGGGVDAYWDEYEQKQMYRGLAGGDSWVKMASGEAVLDAAGGKSTPLVHDYAPPYYQGQTGWVRISWGETAQPAPEPPDAVELDIEEAVDPTPCVSGYRLFEYTGSTQSFHIPINCIWLDIVAEGGDSGGASNIGSIPGQHVADYVNVTPGNTLAIDVGAGGGIKSYWDADADDAAYVGQAGGNTIVRRDDNSMLVGAGGAPRTDIQRQRGSDYFRGQSGWVLIGYGPNPGTPPALPTQTSIPSPDKPEPPCDAGSQTFRSNASFTMPRGCHRLEVEMAGAGGGGGGAGSTGSNGGAGAWVTGHLNTNGGHQLSILVGQGGGTHGSSRATNGYGGGRSALLNTNGSPVAVAGGGGGGSARYDGGAAGKNGASGGAPSCTRHAGSGKNSYSYHIGSAAGGGTQSAGGAAGVSGIGRSTGGKYGGTTCSGRAGQAGGRRVGGTSSNGGGGGDGYYGGGSGGSGGAGGGGSSYIGGLSGARASAGGGIGGMSFSRGQDGWVKLKWSKR